MKKVLFVGTAVAAFAAISAPTFAFDIDFDGRVRFEAAGGEGYADHPTAAWNHVLNGNGHFAMVDDGRQFAAADPLNDGDLSFSNNERLEVNIKNSTCCFTYGGKIRMNDSSNGGFQSDIYIAGDWGRLDYGNLDNARVGAYDTSVIDAGPLHAGTSVAGGTGGPAVALGATNDFAFDDKTVDSTNIVYTAPSIGGFGLKVSTDGTDFEAGVTGNFALPVVGDVGFRVSADENRYGAMATGALFGFKVAAWMGEDDDNDRYSGGAIAKSFDRVGLSLSTSNIRAANDIMGHASQIDTIGGVSYKIADGLTASAAVRSRDHSALGTATDYKARLQLSF